MEIKNGLVFTEDYDFAKGSIYIEDGHIVKESRDSHILDAEGLYVIPGLTDIHFHGCMGYDFCDGTHEAMEAIGRYQGENGVTTICPATMTLGEDTLGKICETAASYERKEGAIFCGMNMEGPYLSEKKKGAQNPAYIKKPDISMYRRLQKKAENMFKLVAIAPEEDGAMEFISELKDEIVVSLAHTTADYDLASEAFKMGASHVTHLYNAMPPFLHREPGVVGAAFDSEQVKVELICDGVHIHPAVVRAAFQMFGDDRIVLISDSMMATGLTDGEYSLGGQAVRVTGNTARLVCDGAIAGSATNLMDCIRTAVKHMGIPLESAIKCGAVNAAKAIGVYDKYGSLSSGKAANLVLLDKELNIKYVMIEGKGYINRLKD